MGIEAIGSIGKVASVVPAVGRATGLSFGRISGFPAPRVEGFSMNRINNPFLGVAKTPTYIENIRPSLLGFRVDSIKNPRIESKIGNFREFGGFSGARRAEAEAIIKRFQLASVIARSLGELKVMKQSGKEIAAFPWVARNDIWKQALVIAPEPMLVRLPKPVANPFQAPQVETKSQSNAQQRVESKGTNRLVRVTSVPSLKEQQVEQITQKKIVTQNKEKERVKEDEQTLQRKIKAVEAVKISKARKEKIVTALRRIISAGISIKEAGKYIRRFISASFWQDKSPLAGSKEDGTINLTLEALEADKNQYDSLQQAEAAYVKPVETFIPLEVGTAGRVGTWGEVKQVIKGEVEVSEQHKYAVVVEARVKKSAQKEITRGAQVETIISETEVLQPKIEDNADLAELFLRKAA